MRAGQGKFSGWNQGMVTPFTMFRWAIPEICKFEGRAIYLDVDQIVLGDISELWAFGDSGLFWQCAVRPDVSVINCDKAPKDWPSMARIRAMHKRNSKDLLRRQAGCKATIDPMWNVDDEVVDGMKLLHFTGIDTQPWKPEWPHVTVKYREHPCPEAVELWHEYYDAGIDFVGHGAGELILANQ